MADRAMETDRRMDRRLDLWEKKLFDLSLRNALLSARMTGNTMAFETGPGETGRILEALQTGTSFSVCPAQEEGASCSECSSQVKSSSLSVCPAQEGAFTAGLLRTEGSAREISQRLRRLQRLGRSSLEETGSASLYWGIGLLRWFDKKTPGQERFAPLLLLPAQISRAHGQVPFSLRAEDETPVINQTLLEKLRIDYGLQTEHLGEPPQEKGGASEAPVPGEGGRSEVPGQGAGGASEVTVPGEGGRSDLETADLKSVFDRFRRLISPVPDWEIRETLCLGIFSYANYRMWEDLHTRRDRILESPIVRSLAGGTIAWREEMDTWQETCARTQVLPVVRLDSSQQLAVRAAAAGKSFVLHGPPGTGKSQTITAILANALAQGQTVLFVAEKMAALSVVYRRLQDLGLEPFCLEIFSRKSRKKDVIEKLRLAADMRAPAPKSQWEDREREHAARLREADRYLTHLHKKGKAGLSVWELMERLAQFPADLAVQEMDPAAAASLTREDLSVRRELLEKLTAAGRAVGHPCGHPLAPVGRTDYTQSYRIGMEEKIGTWLQAVDLLDKALYRYTEKTGQKRPSGKEDLVRQLQIAAELRRWKRLPQAWASAPAPELKTRLEKAAQAVRHWQNLELCRERLRKVFGPEILQIPEDEGDRLRREYDTARKSWAVPRYLGRRRLARELEEYAADGQKVLRGRLGRYTQDILYYQRECRLYREALEACGDQLDQYRDEEGRILIPALKEAVETAVSSTGRLRGLTGDDRVRMECAGKPLYQEETEKLCRAFAVLQEEEKSLKEYLGFCDTPQMRARAREDWFGAQRDFCALLRAHGDGLRDWMYWNRVCREAESCGLGGQVQAYREGMAAEDVVPSWQKSWVSAALRHMIGEDPVLNSFSGTCLEEEMDALRALEADLTGRAREEIRQRIEAGVPDFVAEASGDPLLSTFRRIVLSGGKGMGIREILTLLDPVLPRICPCMLMSPASAAQYLSLDRSPFDLVVFDEASQIATASAVGVLARGKNAVIVGDPRQMPPTSFFAREAGLAEDPLEDDLGSILEDCMAVNLPQLSLLWHYRSRHESLIAFSNAHFYDGRLLTFPSADDGARRVTRIYADGQFESGKSRTNRAEADRIIRELKRRSRTPACRDQSVGIVTFNIQQQTLIEDLYEEACRQDTALAAWAEEMTEPLFIKNLENVQGDERDVILFSTTYGPSPEGRMILNLGPLNREGGWRRLNVAVTRARQEMMVVTSIHPDRDGLDRSLSAGVRMLDAFLRFAGGETDRCRAGTGDPGSGVAQQIRRELRRRGYDGVCGIGRSSFRVDIGIPDPADPSRYLLGILLDGKEIGAGRTLYDLEIGRIDVLEGLGWQLMRVRALDWYDNPARVMDKVVHRLEEILRDRKG